MGIPVLIMGESGSGKTASLRNFNETEVGIFNVAGKPLPFRKKLNKIDNAKGVIFNVRGGENLSLTEINTAVQVINDKVSDDANIIFGTVIDESLQDEMEVTVVATGVEE